MTSFSKLLLGTALLLSAAFVGCSSGEGQSCSNTATYGTGCAPDLACVASTCREKARLDEACFDVPCADGLACATDGRCAMPAAVGASCTDDGQCASRLCNFARPSVTGDSGTCSAPGAAGEPCYWSEAIVRQGGGCDAGLVCAPSAVDAASPPAALPTSSQSPPMFPGTCVANGSVGAGGLCSEEGACQTGTRCTPRDRPVSPTPMLGWTSRAPGQWQYAGPWPDTCSALP